MKNKQNKKRYKLLNDLEKYKSVKLIGAKLFKSYLSQFIVGLKRNSQFHIFL